MGDRHDMSSSDKPVDDTDGMSTLDQRASEHVRFSYFDIDFLVRIWCHAERKPEKQST